MAFKAGAILPNSRGDCENTHWTEQIDFFDKKIVILLLQINNVQSFKQSFVQNTADKVLWRGYWTLYEYNLRKMVRRGVEV